MPEKTRTCPQCGGTMLFRLGEFQCQQCPHTMPAATPEADPRQPTFSQGRPGAYVPGGPGATPPASTSSYDMGGSVYSKRTYEPGAPAPATAQPKLGQSEWDPGAQYRAAPPPPSTGMMAGYGVGGTPPAGLYGADPRDRPISDGGSLQVEKYIYFGLVCIGSLIQLAGGASMMSRAASFGGGSILGTLIGLGLIGWALFGDQAWVKYTCAGCSAIGLIGILGIIFSMDSIMSSAGTPTTSIPGWDMISQFAWVFAVIEIAI